MVNPIISVVIPIFNEEETLPELYARLKKISEISEIIFVNDGSTDNSYEILKGYQQKDPIVKMINFSRNFGHQIAVIAGLDFASGGAVVIMDGDLQDPPEVIPKLVEKWREGYKVVYGVREERRGESAFKRGTARIFYKIIKKLSGIDMPENAGDFRLLDKAAVVAIREIHERHPYIRGMVSWIGFKQTGIGFVRDPRLSGVTKYPLKKMVKFALDAIVSFSAVPLRMATYLGFIIAFVSFLLAIYAIVSKVVFHETLRGWASLMTAILFIGSVQLIVFGILGEYIARIYDQVKSRPLYIIESLVGFEKEE